MNLLRKINEKAKSSDNTGFGTNPSGYGGRFVNKDGSANVEKRGLSFFSRISWYHTMLTMSGWKFLGILLAFYAAINLVFATGYYFIGIEYLNGIDATGSELLKFGKAYFFSAQTFTTVGYGHISPNGFMTSALAAAEALTGLLSFAIATGLFYGRFSRPVAYIKFSHNAIVAPYKGGKGLMIRMAAFKNTNIIDAHARATVGMSVEHDGQLVNKFYPLELEISNISSLSLSWTVVHNINENSPFYGFTKEDFANADGEIILHVKAFDDLFSATVTTSTSYTFGEIVYGAKFDLMYSENEDDTKTILYLDMLNSFKEATLDNPAANTK
jgi:inward rectifier potassium channel